MIFNTIMLVIIVCRLINAAQKTVSHQTDDKNTKATMLPLIGIYCIVILYGTTWFYGTLSMNPISKSFQILFASFNIIQSFCYFTFIALFKEEGRNYWINLLKPRSYRRWFLPTIASDNKGFHQLHMHEKTDYGLELSKLDSGTGQDYASSHAFGQDVVKNSKMLPSSLHIKSSDVRILDVIGQGRDILLSSARCPCMQLMHLYNIIILLLSSTNFGLLILLSRGK